MDQSIEHQPREEPSVGAESLDESAASAVPWYKREIKLNPKVFGISKPVRVLLWIALPLIILFCVTCVPFWRLGWRIPFYGMSNFMPVRTVSGRWLSGAAWFRGKEIRLYRVDAIETLKLTEAVQDMQGLADELNLNFTIKGLPLPDDARRDLQAATVGSGYNARIDFEKFTALRLEHRGEQYAEMFLVNKGFADSSAEGMTLCGSGIAVLHMARRDNLVRHEGTHLLGYDKHDDFPFYIVGYKEDWLPEGRDTMMMLRSINNRRLSSRAKDALYYLWLGLQERQKIQYFKR